MAVEMFLGPDHMATRTVPPMPPMYRAGRGLQSPGRAARARHYTVPVMTSTLQTAFFQARAALDALLADRAAMERLHAIAELIAATFKSGRKVLICGNGGSACDAAHFAEELTGRFRAPPPGRPDRRPLPALACTDPGHITCTANDFGFEHVFARWVGAFGQPGDCLIVLSTSGNSDNILRALDAGKVSGMTTIALLGKTGGPALARADHAVIVPGQGSDRIQELHMLILHAIVEHVEDTLEPRNA